jgi:glucose-1-phosphate cytidylyltransferase
MYNFGQSKGVVEVGKDGIIEAFREKSDTDGDLINIGFMVLEPKIFDYLNNYGDDMPFEKNPLNDLVHDHELVGYVHKGFWQCMDTLREKEKLERYWQSGDAPWKVWGNE